MSPGCEGRTGFLDKMLSRMSKRLVEVAVLGKEAPDGQEPDWLNICDDAADSNKARIADVAQRTPRDLPCSADLTVHGQQMRLPRRANRLAAPERGPRGVQCEGELGGEGKSPCGSREQNHEVEV